MNAQQLTTGKSHILYDADSLGQVDDAFFDPGHWEQQGALLGAAAGRGTTVFIQDGEAVYALRHYKRGGLPAHLSEDRYLWTGLEKSRAFREWRLLAELYGDGLPVPRPVAARVVRDGIAYTADLVTEAIDAKPLAEWAGLRRLSADLLAQVGSTIRLFHANAIFHADLNARNILISDSGEVYLIDFDQGRRREPGRHWQQSNLARLLRSLEKFRRQERDFHFDDEDWKRVMEGYSGRV